MGTAKERFKEYFGAAPGIWFGVTRSKDVVENPDSYETLPLSPAPSFVAVKFGGDWGGLWGDEIKWKQLHDEHPEIVPYLYCTPEHVAEMTGLAGTLYAIGFKTVIFDCEAEWQGSESSLKAMLESMNLADNLACVTSYAWFQSPGGGSGAWADKGEAFGAALDGLDIVYMPQAYFGILEGTDEPGNFVRDELARVFPTAPLSYVVDVASMNVARQIAQATGTSVSVWHYDNLDGNLWTDTTNETGDPTEPPVYDPDNPDSYPDVPPVVPEPPVDEPPYQPPFEPPVETSPIVNVPPVVEIPPVNAALVDATWPRYAAVNPNVYVQYEQWYTARVILGQDATDMTAFRLHLTGLGAPDPTEPVHPELPITVFPIPTDAQWLAVKEAGTAFLEAAFRQINQH